MTIGTLSEIADIFNGKTPSKAEQRNSGFPVLKIRDIDENGEFRGEYESFVERSLVDKFTEKILREHDILLLNAAHNSAYVGSKNCFVTNKFAGSLATGEWSIIRARKEKVLPKYVYFFINSYRGKNEIKNIVKGIHLYPKDLNRIQITIPNLDAQKVIVRILNQVEALRQKRKQAIDLLDEYLKSVFLEMFGDPVINTKKWDKKPLSGFGEVITGNTPSRADKSNYADNFIEWIKTDNIVEGKMYLTHANEYLSEAGFKKARFITSGAVLMACIAGSVESIGRVALADRKVSFNQQINAIQPNDKVNPVYLYWLFRITKSFIQEQATRGMKKILTKGEFEKIEMIIPSIDLQNKFAKLAEEAEDLKQKMLKQSEELDNQFHALMQKHFDSN